MKRVLVVDDDRDMAASSPTVSSIAGGRRPRVSSSTEAIAKLGEPYDAVVTDLRMPGIDGLELVAQSRKIAPERPVIVMTAFSAVDTAVESIRRGAYHYLTKPFKLDELDLFLGRALDEARLRTRAQSLELAMRDRFSRESMVGASQSMQRVFDLACACRRRERSAPHHRARRARAKACSRARSTPRVARAAPFVTVNCAALPETLLESELFGHKKGAFTGATQSRDGLFIASERRHALARRDRRDGVAAASEATRRDRARRGASARSDVERAASARIIAATHRDLRERVAAGAFRQDLLYRLEVVVVEIPALRHHRDDLPLLIGRFLAASQARHPSSPLVRFSDAALDRLMKHEWPGNVRELENVIERVVLLARAAEAGLSDLPSTVTTETQSATTIGGPIVTMREAQKRYAAYAYEKLGATKAQTAEALGIDVKTLGKLLSSDPE